MGFYFVVAVSIVGVEFSLRTCATVFTQKLTYVTEINSEFNE